MKAKPILFSGEMVRAILDGRKTQTRRVVKPQPDVPSELEHAVSAAWEDGFIDVKCPYGQVGDVLWVRENGWEPPFITAKMEYEGADTWPDYIYDADGEDDVQQLREWGWKRRPSIHMPRWASRLTLEITNVRVERLQDISEQDAIAEGCMPYTDVCANTRKRFNVSAIEAFRNLWIKIHGSDRVFHGESALGANPWVWVIQFEAHCINVNKYMEQAA